MVTTWPACPNCGSDDTRCEAPSWSGTNEEGALQVSAYAHCFNCSVDFEFIASLGAIKSNVLSQDDAWAAEQGSLRG